MTRRAALGPARFDGALRAVEGLPRPAAWTLSVAGVLGVGALDYRTGFEVSFAFFYLTPVALAAWVLGRGPGWAVSLGSASTWLVANRLAGEVLSSSVIQYWNGLSRLGFFVLVTELLVRLRAAFEQLRTLSRQDFLTGVLNARGFYAAAAGECARLRRHRRPLTVAYLDLDGFKQVNDALGHEAGDRVLQAVAEGLRGGVRSVDTVARLGGDEFALLLPETDAASARALLGRLRDDLLDRMRRGAWAVTVSAGALTCTGAPQDVDDLVRRADHLMYEAKAAGKDAILFREYAGTRAQGRG